MTVLLAIGAVVLLLALFVISVYNKLVKLRVLVKEGWSGVGTFLQMRNDVIPNMVETVKGYAGHENKTLTEVTMWRNKSAMANTPQEQMEASAGLQRAMLDFYTVTEQYPELKADRHFIKLQEDLKEIEEKINASRRYYNGTAREFNMKATVFPNNLVAGMFDFKEEAFFQEDEEARKAPKVQF
jgi:LemA protein